MGLPAPSTTESGPRCLVTGTLHRPAHSTGLKRRDRGLVVVRRGRASRGGDRRARARRSGLRSRVPGPGRAQPGEDRAHRDIHRECVTHIFKLKVRSE